MIRSAQTPSPSPEPATSVEDRDIVRTTGKPIFVYGSFEDFSAYYPQGYEGDKPDWVKSNPMVVGDMLNNEYKYKQR